MSFISQVVSDLWNTLSHEHVISTASFTPWPQYCQIKTLGEIWCAIHNIQWSRRTLAVNDIAMKCIMLAAEGPKYWNSFFIVTTRGYKGREGIKKVFFGIVYGPCCDYHNFSTVDTALLLYWAENQLVTTVVIEMTQRSQQLTHNYVLCDGPNVTPFIHTLSCENMYRFPLNFIHECVCVKNRPYNP